MASVKALINPELLVWARQQAGYSQEQLADAVGVESPTYAGWESGAEKPSVPQAKKLAKTCRISFAVFYLPKPPEEPGRPVDFRTVLSGESSFSPDILAEIRQAKFRREIMLEVLDRDEVQGFPVSTELDEDHRVAARKIRDFLGVTMEEQRKVAKAHAFDFWRGRFESKGILVFQMFKIEPHLARGLSLYFPELPVVLTNVKDAVAGRVFTLFHELVHLMLRGDAICEMVEDPEASQAKARVEAFCNRVAAEALVPQSDLEERIAKQQLSGEPDDKFLTSLSHRYKVSSLVVCRRLLDLGRVSRAFYAGKQKLHDDEVEVRRAKRKADLEARRAKGKGGGLSPVQELFSRSGETYVRTVLGGYSDGRLSSSEVSEALGVRWKHLAKIEAKL